MKNHLLSLLLICFALLTSGLVPAYSEGGSDPDPDRWLEDYRAQLPADQKDYPDINAGMKAAEEDFTETDAELRKTAAEMLKNADEKYFPRIGYSWSFSESQGVVNEFLEPDIIHQYYVLGGKGTDILMSMLPAAAGARTGNKRLDHPESWKDEFHVSYTMQRREDIPAGKGGRCWIRYDNAAAKGANAQSGVILFPGERAYYFKTVSGEVTYTAIGDLSGLDQDELLKFDFIRISGTCYFYANGEFLFSFHDGIPGNVSFKSGSELFAGGSRVLCEFDDFVMTYR